MKQRKNILERVVHGADLITEPLPRQALVELAGEHRLLIENHHGVTEYGTNEICVKVSYGQLSVYGSCLELARMTKEQLVITGRIDGVKVCRGRK